MIQIVNVIKKKKMTDALLITLVIGASWVVFSLINIVIASVLKKKGGGIHPFFMFCPVVNVLCGFVCWLVYLDEKRDGKEKRT